MWQTSQTPRAEVSSVRFTIRSWRACRVPGRVSSKISPLHVCRANFSLRYSAAACGCFMSCWGVKNLSWHLAQPARVGVLFTYCRKTSWRSPISAFSLATAIRGCATQRVPAEHIYGRQPAPRYRAPYAGYGVSPELAVGCTQSTTLSPPMRFPLRGGCFQVEQQCGLPSSTLLGRCTERPARSYSP
jgi:hypothetical protein